MNFNILNIFLRCLLASSILLLSSCVLGLPLIVLIEACDYEKFLSEGDPRFDSVIDRKFELTKNAFIFAFNVEKDKLFLDDCIPKISIISENGLNELGFAYFEEVEKGSQFVIKKAAVGATYLYFGAETSSRKNLYAYFENKDFLVDVSFCFEEDFSDEWELKPKLKLVREVISN